ncbi:MAG: FlgD immunoglobulin-like domain containing protein, partial [Candidatus Tenebribacter burtonii]|nr:FlgD immunoglobulin-like domain containing protein [Candidatus Tenebribacter burtonii]
SGESRSEAFIRAGSSGNPTGAIAAIGTATSGTHTNFNNCIDAGIYYGIFTDGIYNPGGAVNRGKIALYEHYPQNPGGYTENFTHMNTLIGDPGVALWTGVPQDIIADYETEISPGTNYLEIQVENSSGFPIADAWVTALMGDDEIFATGYTDENGYIALEINAMLEGTATLTVTKHNYIPHLGGFDVGEVDKFINVFEVIIDDDNAGTSSGNDDGYINPGEDIELRVSLKNFGTQTANSVTATIITNDDFVTITDAVENFGNIPSGNSVYCTDDFDFSIAEDVLGGTEIRLDIVIEDNAGNTWNDIIFLVVEGANLDAADYEVLDGGNGILDPGEVVEMTVSLQNLGSVTADAVYGELTSTNSRITVSDDNGYFGNIIAGEQASNITDTFELIANTQLVVGTQVIMEIHLHNTDGYDNTTQFILNVGEVIITDPLGPDAYSYFCYDDGDLSYFNVPSYDWIEINNIGSDLNLYDPGNTGAIATISEFPITFKMYGEEYDIMTVCSNGWIAPGGSTQGSFMNSPIPGPQGPSPMIAPFWDDLKTGSGDVYWHYDSSLHTVIIEWDHLQNDPNQEETFQVILYDANYYPTFTGDSEIKFQYKVVHNTSAGSYPSQHGQYSSVGLEDPSGTIGLEYTFNNSYPIAAKTLQNQMALLFTTSSQYWGFIAGEVTLIGGSGNIDEVNITNGVTYTNPDQMGDYIYPQLPGTYDITASLVGYTSITENDIEVIENETTFVDFILEALPIPTGFISNAIEYNDVELTWNLPESVSRETNVTGHKKHSSENSREHIGYKVYRDGTEIATIADPAILTYADLALPAGTYNYYVTAIHDLGESLPSNQDEVMINFPAPQNPQAVTQGLNIFVTWDEPATRELVSYKVYRNLIMIADGIEVTSYLDPEMENGTYSYNVRAIYSGDYQSSLSIDAVIDHIQTNTEGILIPKTTYLEGNYPNPFNPETVINYALRSNSQVLIQIYNVKGEKVKKLIDGKIDAGFHSTVWNGKDNNGKNVASGIYLYRFKTIGIDQTKKMMLIK